MANQSTTNTSPNKDRSYPAGYGVVEPVANYRPWDVDVAFGRIYEQVREHTMVDVYRLWILWTLARRLPDGDILEVGSWRGGSGAVIATAASANEGAAGEPPAASPNPARRIFLADTFAGVVKAGERDPYYKGGEHANTSTAHVRELLDGLGLDSVELLEGVFPDETGERIADGHFAMCHIDVDVYQSAIDAFGWVWPRMVAGGVVVFDDYGFYGCEGVAACVEEIMATVPEAVVIPNLSGQAVVVRPSLSEQ